MSATRDLTFWRWIALALLAAALVIMIAPTLPYNIAVNDGRDIVTRHTSWFDPFVIGGGANFSAWLAIAGLVVSAALTVIAATQARAGASGPFRSPMIACAVSAILAGVAVWFGGGGSLWGWAAVGLLAAAAVANLLPTRPAGRPLLPTQPSR